MAESKEEFDQRIADAKIAFGKNDERAKIHAAQVQTFSSDAMKAPALVSAAGVAAALGFYSANYDRLSQSPENLQTFNSILFWLFASLLFIVCAPGFAYFSQIAYGAAIYATSILSPLRPPSRNASDGWATFSDGSPWCWLSRRLPA
ncbi:hypothetical protein NLY43_18990 [Mesorhizobium sp. C416B]|uniref:hypothetical protein n=1 Tax=unclassified Mesorhizobium TaxID=325217 RepID=UPI0003CE1D7A|nr:MULTISPECIES: hypothetical protein [unclassified Mesorhizobium]ESX51343.1 hypothetical protein X762_04840 [Mesorhizobium sp. LSHC426A00]ESX52716.1 hypothetical protein X761_22765 [Mesorhizobium sp. LSHC424B00]ESX66825.1 hypothetical protein X758_25200 [Mesorhizobium sp. LSHC416B00]WJI60708.1 hypothetical protein NLY43_18990 [Mesorhizobium sp. C416B]